MNINSQTYNNVAPQTTVEQSNVGRANATAKIATAEVGNERSRVNKHTYQQDNQRQDNKTNKESLSQEEYELVAQAHQENQTMYDKPQGNQRLAISSYQSVLHAPKREEIQRLVGIDTFA